MALSKTLTTDFGVNATYICIADFTINHSSKTAQARFCAFLDETTRRAPNSRALIDNIQYRVDGAGYDLTPDQNVWEWFYTKLKAEPGWEDATDIL